jgi:signal transduction histidine kinase
LSKTLRIAIYAVPVVIGALIFIAAVPDSVKINITPLLRNLAAGLFLTAGVLRMAAWRLTRDAATAHSALALLILGTALPSTSVLRLFVHDGEAVQIEAPETRMVLILPLLALAILGARHSQRLMRHTFAILVAVTLAVPAAVVLPGGSAPSGEHHVGVWLAVEALTAAVWTALAVQALSRRRIAGQDTPGWITVGLGLMAFTDVCKAWGISEAGAPRGLSSVLQLVAAVVAVGVAASGLWTSIRTETADAGTLTRALVDTQLRLDHIEDRQRLRLHDARSAVIGVVGASELLANPGRLDEADSAKLRRMVTAELGRLEGLLQIEDEEQCAEFELASTLAAVVLSHRLNGMIIDLAWQDAHALGHPQATATVVDNLLTNVHRHAPGARVLIAARTLGEQVEITVSDDGPGIPAGELRAVLRAGVRGSTACGDGSGFGLYSAERTMVAQTGSLDIGASVCGGTEVVLRMPAAISHALAS